MAKAAFDTSHVALCPGTTFYPFRIKNNFWNEFGKKVFNKILYMVSTAVRTTYRYSFKIVNYSAMTEGQHLSQHNHTGCDFSTIHYLNFKNDHVLTCLSNPSSYSLFLRKLQPDLSNILQANKDHSYFQDSHHFPVEEDDMVIFPASLIHEVWPQGPTKEPRVTISSNIRIRYGE